MTQTVIGNENKERIEVRCSKTGLLLGWMPKLREPSREYPPILEIQLKENIFEKKYTEPSDVAITEPERVTFEKTCITWPWCRVTCYIVNIDDWNRLLESHSNFMRGKENG
ncbi:hypothetical protein LCGC14_1776160 [marine sediment metagenome]|uniref:Uncharacterized protein n=1 Tax=marine sediment metagenome TaxID=412755 RepID=A0A0F9GX06_9ZZZZ|nr:hypothetical protein [Candidatus Scalindua sp.]